MMDKLQELLAPGPLKNTLFPPTSRYHGIDTAIMETVEGRRIVHMCRRFVPQPERFAMLQEHTVSQGDRLDNITAQYIGDPEQFWRICDANGAIRPNELIETVGRKLKITLPEGIPGIPDA